MVFTIRSSIAELNAEADTTEESISISQLNQWAFQTAKGMQYLAAKKVKINAYMQWRLEGLVLKRVFPIHAGYSR